MGADRIRRPSRDAVDPPTVSFATAARYSPLSISPAAKRLSRTICASGTDRGRDASSLTTPHEVTANAETEKTIVDVATIEPMSMFVSTAALVPASRIETA